MSFSEWKSLKLGDICDVKGGKRLPKGKSLLGTKTSHPYIRIRDMYQHKYVEEDGTAEYIDDETYKSISRYTVSGGDVIIAIVGNTIGLVSLVGDSLNKANLTENCVKLINLRDVNSEFIYYYLNSDVGQRILKSKIVGTSQPKLPIYGVKDIDLPVPSIEEQESIVKLLSSLDARIGVNNRINKNLDEIIQAIFKQWFIDFEFSNDNGLPYKSSGGKMTESEFGMIPEGWEIKSLCDVADIVGGATPSKKKDEYYCDEEYLGLPRKTYRIVKINI